MQRILIRDGHLVDPVSGQEGPGHVAIDQGRIVAVGETVPEGFEPERVVSAAGQWVFPGLFDLRAWLRQPGYEHKGTLATELRAAVRGGVTSLCCPPATRPVNDTAAVTRLILDLSGDLALARVHPLGALTRGLNGEQLSDMQALKEAGCIALTQLRQPFRSSKVMKRCLEYACSHDITVHVLPEDPALAADGVVHEGGVASRLGLAGIPVSAETLAVGQWLMLAEDTGARLHLGGLSSRRSVELIAEARARGLAVTCDVAVANLLFNEHCIEDFDARFHVRPPLRSEADRRALLAAVVDGSVDAICSQHEPHETSAVTAPFAETEPGMSQLETWLSNLLQLSRHAGVPFRSLLAAASSRPARIAGQTTVALEAGAVADLVVFDPRAEWHPGRDAWVSAGRNSPWIGAALPGVVTLTVVGGRMVYSEQGVA